VASSSNLKIEATCPYGKTGFFELHSLTTHKTVVFLAIAMRTPDPIKY
jgi:hypothetical protein